MKYFKKTDMPRRYRVDFYEKLAKKDYPDQLRIVLNGYCFGSSVNYLYVYTHYKDLIATITLRREMHYEGLRREMGDRLIYI